MNEGQEVLSEVIHDKEVSHVGKAVQNLQSAPPLDSKADELRSRLLALLIKAATAGTSSPSPEPGQKLPRKTEQGLKEEFAQWRKDYDEWLKGAARVYNGPAQ